MKRKSRFDQPVNARGGRARLAFGGEPAVPPAHVGHELPHPLPAFAEGTARVGVEVERASAGADDHRIVDLGAHDARLTV
jgi:hypothetical protein